MHKLKKRILDISFKHKLSHLGSCLTSLGIIADIYKKHPKDTFVLSCGHAALAWYVVLEEVYGFDAEMLFEKHGVHPNRDLEHHIPCSSGSLGHALPVCVGMAFASPHKKFHCLVSDGEMAEGSIWEALRFINQSRMKNIKVYVNCNGYGAYDKINADWLENALAALTNNVDVIRFIRTNFEFDFLQGQDAHYHILTEEEYEKALCQLHSPGDA